MKILIAGLAKTGTTGLLYLIANSIGPQRKLLFEPKVCPPAIASDAGHVVAKVLIGANLKIESFSHFDRKITIVRDLRDTIISALLYSQFHGKYHDDNSRVRRVLDSLKQKESSPSSISVREMFEITSEARGKTDPQGNYVRWIKQLPVWLDRYVQAMPDALLYKYEMFVSGDYAALEKHLGMPITGTAEVPESLGRVTRTKGYGDWRNWFTPADVQEFRPMLEHWLGKYGYDADDWALNPEPVIEPAHCSGYFLRLIEENRESEASEFGTRKGKIVRAEPTIVAGWAIGADPKQPVRLALVVNGQEVSQALADKPRPAFKERGIHPTGQCGFVFQFRPAEALRAGDQVSIKPVDGTFVFENSSRIVKVAVS